MGLTDCFLLFKSIRISLQLRVCFALANGRLFIMFSDRSDMHDLSGTKFGLTEPIPHRAVYVYTAELHDSKWLDLAIKRMH